MNEVYKRTIAIIKQGFEIEKKSTWYTMEFDEYNNFFDFSIEYNGSKPNERLKKENKLFDLVEEIIYMHDTYAIINFGSLQKHEILTGELSDTQLSPILILYKKQHITEDKKEITHSFGSFTNLIDNGILLKSVLFIKTKPEKPGREHRIFFPGRITISSDLKILQNKSIFTVYNRH